MITKILACRNLRKNGANTTKWWQAHHIHLCHDIIECFQTESDLLCKVFTDIETWIFENELWAKRQNRQ